MSDEEVGLLDEEKDKDQIKAELSEMSFEDLQKLKEKLGTKVYNEAVFGPKRLRKVEFKRENKNRPREMSSKKPVPRFREVVQLKKHIPRDPRFDSLCGTFNPKIFKKAYGFLSDVKKDDIKKLRNELQETDDPKMIKKIKYLIQRLENQLREEHRSNQKEQKVYQEKKEVAEAIKRGEKPNFKRKSERKVLDLVSQYEELKNSGKLKKHIQRLRKKNLRRDREKLAADTE
ncbi:ribosomal RNA processing protein 36 homolog [Nomia melanderi]|uniref:ribosomal RNA processing protein 36 homolog n=1 Tax=Nomia melanderi TaxID=2448451 RepID=UPI0013043C4B|nr:ribosomal RNA processing protein 36 homolog [Nomia melanderi]